MNPILMATGIAVSAGAVVTVSARDARIALGGLTVTFAVAPFVADPQPEPLALAARIVAAALAAYLVWMVVRRPGSVTRGSLLGWPTEALIAAAAFVIGYGTAGLGAPAVGPAEAQASGLTLISLAVGPLVFGRDVFRLGTGAALLVGGIVLVGVALAGTPSSLAALVTGGLVVALGASIAFLVAGAETAGAAGAEVLVPDASAVARQAARPPGR